MAIRWEEFLANIERYKKALPPDEPIVLPRREAKRRRVNKEQRKRVIFDADPQGYAEFHAVREAWLGELGENPTLFLHAMLTAMRTFDLRGWVQRQETEQAEQDDADWEMGRKGSAGE